MENEQITDQVTSPEPIPGEIYHVSKGVKIALLAVAGLCLILAISTFNVPLEFDYLFDSMPYFAGFLILGLLLLGIFAFSFGEKRKDPKIYLTADGKLDIGTSRIYEALNVPAFVNFLGRSHKQKKEGLLSFKYKDGIVTIYTTELNYISAPLSELTWKYSMTKPKGADDWEIYKYTLTDASGQSIEFYQNSATFMEEEWDDINMLLSLSGKVEETTSSKITKKMTEILEKIEDFDFSDIAGSVAAAAVGTATAASNKIIDMVKVKVYGEAKKNTLWEKIKDKLLWIGLGLYILIVLFINVFNIVEYLSTGKEESVTERIAATYDAHDSYMEEEAVVDDAVELTNGEYEMTGYIDWSYDIVMTINPEDRSGYYYYVSNGPGNPIYLDITKFDADDLILEEFTNGRHTGTFRGHLSFSRYGFSYEGTFTNALNGREMPFFCKER